MKTRFLAVFLLVTGVNALVWGQSRQNSIVSATGGVELNHVDGWALKYNVLGTYEVQLLGAFSVVTGLEFDKFSYSIEHSLSTRLVQEASKRTVIVFAGLKIRVDSQFSPFILFGAGTAYTWEDDVYMTNVMSPTSTVLHGGSRWFPAPLIAAGIDVSLTSHLTLGLGVRIGRDGEQNRSWVQGKLGWTI